MAAKLFEDSLRLIGLEDEILVGRFDKYKPNA